MSESVQQPLSSFDQLPESEQQEALYAILKRVQELDYPLLDDEVLAQIADETWQIYDADEATNAQR